MAIRVRTCRTLAEFKQAVGAISEYGGWEVDDDIAKRFLRAHPLDHMHAAFDGRRAVGGAGAFPFDMSVPGGSVACAGVTVVGVYPTHRRQGVLTAMMRAQLDAAHERGEPIAALWASDERIYGRYGYGLASLTGEIELPRTHAEFAAPIEDPGTVSYVEPKDVPKVLGPIWKHVFRERPGMFARSAEWWKSRIAHDPPQWRRGAGPRRYAVVELGGSVEGYAIYRHDPRWEGGVPDAGTVAVGEVLARSLEAEIALWRYLCDIEWAGAVSARLLPLDHPLWWILAQPRRMKMRVGDGLWVRLLDVGAALSARSYSAHGPITFQVQDDFCSWNAGRWKLEDGVAKKTRADADLACGVAALGSVYLGGFTFAQLARGGSVEELKRGAAARADSVFRTDILPWCPEVF
ncbi:MAG: GNAT family N-acetyltransferase [Gaiellaceae bacterium]